MVVPLSATSIRVVSELTPLGPRQCERVEREREQRDHAGDPQAGAADVVGVQDGQRRKTRRPRSWRRRPSPPRGGAGRPRSSGASSRRARTRRRRHGPAAASAATPSARPVRPGRGRARSRRRASPRHDRLRNLSGFRRGSTGGASSAFARWRMTRNGIASGTAA